MKEPRTACDCTSVPVQIETVWLLLELATNFVEKSGTGEEVCIKLNCVWPTNNGFA